MGEFSSVQFSLVQFSRFVRASLALLMLS